MTIITSNRIAFASLLVVANAALAQAQEINSYEDYQLYCSDAAYQYDVASPYCDDYKPYYQERIQEEIQPQNTNPDVNKIERRSIRRNDVYGYAGLTLGAFYPDNEDAETGGGSVLFVGGRWNRYFATDLEIIRFVGAEELFDPDYYVWAFTINPRLIIPFNNNYNSATIFVSPGVGVSIVTDFYDSETSLAWQVKGGFTIPIGNKFNIILQGRYISQFEEEAEGAVSTELGFSVNFN